MNELKLMAMKAKSRLLNKGLREVYSNANTTEIKKDLDIKDFSNPSLNIASEAGRKKQILDMIKSRFF